MSLAMDIELQPSYSSKQFLYDLIKQGLWVSKEKGIIRIDEMSESHIRNAEKKFKVKLTKDTK